VAAPVEDVKVCVRWSFWPNHHRFPSGWGAPHRPAHYATGQLDRVTDSYQFPQFGLGVSHGRWRIRHRSPSAVGFRHAAWDPTSFCSSSSSDHHHL